MAAWSDHDEVELAQSLGSRTRPFREASTPDATPSTEPFPLEVWTFFTDSDLDQLVVDVCAEIGRREIAKRS